MGQVNYSSATFIASYGMVQQLPKPTTPEVAFVGRSNVGKSSLINRLLNRKGLAKVSATPGKTANINFFDVDGITFVDLPGYGYAKVSQAERDRWANLISGYFDQDRSFNLVVSLVDIRHDVQQLDRQMIDFLRAEELPFVVALTKADKLSRNKAVQHRTRLSKGLDVPASQMILTSAETGLGIDELRKAIEDACL